MEDNNPKGSLCIHLHCIFGVRNLHCRSYKEESTAEAASESRAERRRSSTGHETARATVTAARQLWLDKEGIDGVSEVEQCEEVGGEGI